MIFAILFLAIYISQYYAQVVSVYDGDTATFRVEFTRHLLWTPTIRIRGMDAPEIRGKCKTERELALKAKETLRELVSKGVILKNMEDDKYGGRHLADIDTINGESVADLMIKTGLARPYDGKAKRQGWC
jgi:micrococcal nuclease